MTSIDDLRASLTAHADTLDAEPGASRVDRQAALRARIRRARNQRRAAIAGGTAAVVLAVGGVYAAISAPDTRHSSTPEIAGHTLERALSIDGFEYDLDQTAQSSPGSHQLTLTLPASHRDRYVRLVGTGIGQGDATLLQGTDAPRTANGVTTYDSGSFLDRIATDSAVDAPVSVPADKTTLTVRLRDASSTAVVGLAVYDQSTVMPAGVSAGDMAFPQTVGDERLVAATIGKVGERSVSITFQGPVRHPDLESLCTSVTKHIFGHVTETGTKGWSGGDCSEPDPVFDTNLGVFHGEGVPDAGYGPGTHTLTLTAMHHTSHIRTDSPLAEGEAADLRLALGLYDDPSPVRKVDGMEWSERMLDGGRLWQLDEVRPYREGLRVDATEGTVMLGLSHTGKTSDYCLSATGDNGDVLTFDCDSSNVGGASGSWGQTLMPGTTYSLRTSRWDDGHAAGTGLGHVLVYRPVG